MAVYSATAPDGKTYRVIGPAGASEDDVRKEILAQNPNAGNAAPATPAPAKEPGIGDALGTFVKRAIPSAGEVTKGFMQQFGPEGLPAQAVMHPIQTLDAVKSTASHAADILSGGEQRLIDKFAPSTQDDAPRSDTTAFDKFAGDVKDKYGTPLKALNTVAQNPAQHILAAASILDPALSASGVEGGVLGAASRGLAKVPRPNIPVPAAVRNIATAGRTADAGFGTMRGAAMSEAATQGDAAAQAAAEASAQADRAAQLAAQSRGQRAPLVARQSDAAAAAVPPTPDVGTPGHLTDLGQAVRDPAAANEDALNAQMRAADDKHRTAMQAVVDDQAAKGIGVSDMPMAKMLIKRSKAIVEPDPATRAAVGSVPADSAGAKLHDMLLKTLEPQDIGLTEDQAAIARKQGIEVKTDSDGPYRTIKPDFKAVDDFRRYLGKVLDGSVEGYEAINKTEAQGMYNGLSKVLDKYTQGASTKVQRAYREAKAGLAPYENMRAGQAVVGTQPGTPGVFNTPASSIPGKILAGGRDTAQQVASVAGQAPVTGLIRSQVQNALMGAKTSDAAAALVRPGSPLGDLVSGDPQLTADVNTHIQNMRSAEQSAQNAAALGKRVGTVDTRTQQLADRSGELQGTAAKATTTARGYQQQLQALKTASPKEISDAYEAMLNRQHTAGDIDDLGLAKGRALMNSTNQAFKVQLMRNRLIAGAAGALGVGAITKEGANLVAAAGGQ